MDFRGIRGKTISTLNLDELHLLKGSYTCFENTRASLNQFKMKVEMRFLSNDQKFWQPKTE